MNASVTLKVNGNGNGSGDSGGKPPGTAGWHRPRRTTAAGIGLWAFIGVATALFSLFIAAYIMRMDSSDWSPVTLPPQLWLSSALLVVGSVLLQRSSAAAQALWMHRARILLMLGGACALAFLAVQLWAWQALRAMQVTLSGNPAGSFFFLLTAMHGLHVAGGLVGWGLTVRNAWHADPARTALRISLCARYWHFLLAVWIVLFATLGWLTPDVVRFICGTR